jgi:outer membrane receptor for ferric coprogen and ferric-rhodotorulic acid
MALDNPRTVREYVAMVLAAAALLAASRAQGAQAIVVAAGGEPQETQPSESRPATDAGGPTPGSTEEAAAEVVIRGRAVKFRPDDQSSATGLAMPLIDTPQAISVITSNMLDVVGAQSIYSATDLIPGVTRDGTGFGYERILMRGINNAFERLNGVELNSLNYTIDGFALERTEVVRGPATALYGVTGSFGGEVNSVLKRPTSETHLQAGVETGTFDKAIYTADLSGSIPGTGGALTGRIVDKYEGYKPEVAFDIHNRKEVLLGSLSWELSPVTSATIWQYHADRHIDPVDGGALFLEPNGQLALPPASIDPERFYFSLQSQSREHTQLNVSVLEFLHTFDNGWRLKSESVYSDYKQQISYFYPFGPFGAYGNAPNNISIYTYDITRHNEDVTTDLSLGGDFDWLGHKQSFFAALEGVEALEPSNFTLLNSEFTGTANAFQGGQPVYADGTPWVPVDRSNLGIRQIQLSNVRDVKASFQLLLHPLDRVSLLLGALVHRGKETDVVPIASSKVLDPPETQKIEFTKFVKRMGLVYDLIESRGPIDGVKGYFNYSEGFQPQTIVNKQAQAEPFPQNMKQYELGVKGEFLDHAVGGSLAAYRYNITNVPAGATPIGQFGAFGTTVADGEQKATGVEAELTGELLPGWNLSANYAYADIYIANPEYTFTSNVANVPKHKGGVFTSYEFLQGPLRGLRLGADAVISGDYPLVHGLVNVKHWGQIYENGSTRVDLNLSYRLFGNKQQGLELYTNVHNLFDRRVLYSKEGTPAYGIQFSDLRAVNVGLRYRM